jgi:hypothetical protein
MSTKEKSQVSFENYPFFIAQPYEKSLNAEDSQRKDWQRMCLEMTLAFNASVCLACHYANRSTPAAEEESSETDEGKKLELGMTSLGKWNQIARDVSKKLKKADFMAGQISDLYSGNKKNWSDAVDELIKRRNDDAHGALKDGEDLKKELEERQKKLEQVLNELSFYNNYKFLVSTGEEVKDGGLVYHFKDLSGDGNGSFELKQDELTDEVEPLLTYLYSPKTKKCLLLDPMILSHSRDTASETSTYVYNKTINDKGDLHYYNHRKTIDLRSGVEDGEGNRRGQNELCRSFRKFRVYFEDEDEQKRNKPEITVSRSFPSKFIAKVGDEVEMTLVLKNTGKAAAEDLKFLCKDPNVPFTYPSEGGKKNQLFVPKPEEEESEEFPPKILEAGKTIKRIYKLEAKKGGIFQFDEIFLTYDYEDDLTRETVEGNLEKEINVSTADQAILQVLDPNDPQAQVPIVNLSFGYSKTNPKIGEEFEYLVTADNIGRGIAHDLELHIFPPPKDMELISGSTRWQGNLNPGEKVQRRFFLRSRKEGVFGIRMRDALYRNLEGNLFKTLAYEDQKVLVLNDPKEKYRYLLEDAWHDLKIEKEEEARIERNKGFTELEIDQKKKIETDVKIMAYGRVIEKRLSQNGLSFRKISKKGEMVYCYEAGEFLFPLVILSFHKEKEFQVLIKGRSKDSEMKNTWKGRWNNVPFSVFSVEKLSKEQEPLHKVNKEIGDRIKAFAPVKTQIEFLLRLGLEMQAPDLFEKISLDGESVQAIVSKTMIGQYVFDKIGLSVEQVSNNQVQHLVEVSWPQEGNAELKKYLPKDYEGVGHTKVRMPFESKGSEVIDEMIQKLENLLRDMVEGKSTLALEELEKTDGLKDAINSLKKDEGVHCRKERIVVRRDNDGNIKKEEDYLVFYRGRERPYYDPTLAFMRYDPEKKKVHLHYLDKETFLDLDQEGKGDLKTHRTGKNGWLYELSGDVVTVEMTRKAYDQTKRGEPHPVTYGLLHACLKDFDFLEKPLLEMVKKNDWTSLPADRNLKGVSSTVNKLNLRPFLEYRSGAKGNAGQFKILENSLEELKGFMDDMNA